MVRLGGPSCLAGDVIGDYRLPFAPEPGQRFAFLDQAHYSMVKTTTFNGVPLPSIWLWDSETDTLEQVRKFGYEDFRDRLSRLFLAPNGERIRSVASLLARRSWRGAAARRPASPLSKLR